VCDRTALTHPVTHPEHMMEIDEVTEMALTPEDVVNKRFNPTKFREGYDQDEVDDFLDEVVVELRRLNQENEELRQRLVAGEARINELQRSGAAAPAAAPVAQLAPVAAPEPAPAFAAQPDTAAMDPSNTNNLLQLARRLHEEHVREGMEKRDALISEGHATAARLVSEAQQAQQAQLAGLEQEKQSLEQDKQSLEQEKQSLEQEKQSLEQEKQSLEQKVDELRSFEKEYREKLRAYIQEQLQGLEDTNVLTTGSVPEAAAPVAAEPAPEFQPAQAAAPAGYTGPQSPDYAAYPQPTDHPGFAAGN
jgi:DivIVA domain-containing protein